MRAVDTSATTAETSFCRAASIPARRVHLPCAGRRSSGGGTCVPTSTETPIERGSVTRCDGHGVNRGIGSGSRASPGGRPGAPLPRVRGPVDPADRRPSGPFAGDGQGVLPRPDRGEGAGVQGLCAARKRSRATARARGTRTARRANPARSSGTGPPSACRAMIEWRSRYGRLPTSDDWSRTHARRCGGEAVARLAEGEWPAASFVTRLFGTLSAARAASAEQAGEMTSEPASASESFGRESISLPKPPGIRRYIRGSERR